MSYQFESSQQSTTLMDFLKKEGMKARLFNTEARRHWSTEVKEFWSLSH